MIQSHDVSTLVDAALSHYPAPDANAQVIAVGGEAVPILIDRLKCGEPSKLADIIALLAAIGTPATIPPLLPLMADGSFDIRERSARAVYTTVIANGVPDTTDFAEAIVASLDDKPGGAALLLAGFVPQARTALIAHVNDSHLVKLDNAGPAVPAGKVATMALALLGEPQALASFETSIPISSPDMLEFYLSAITLIVDPIVLSALAKATLENMTPISNNLPSGIVPPRRLADRAVEAFVKRLNLRPGFALDYTQRYSDQDFREIRQLIVKTIPR
jgi:hypothetical protein